MAETTDLRHAALKRDIRKGMDSFIGGIEAVKEFIPARLAKLEESRTNVEAQVADGDLRSKDKKAYEATLEEYDAERAALTAYYVEAFGSEPDADGR